MKKAVVVGGSNGIGLATANELMDQGYHVHILDICQPTIVKNSSFSYSFCDLLNLDTDFLRSLALDKEIEILMITAGIGRVAEFEFLHIAEIEKLVRIDLTSTIKIISCFYGRIKSQDRFYCGIVSSIAGLVSSPMFSVYAAAKAGLCRFIESVNIELSVANIDNRILNIAPLAVKGTRFNGNENNLSEVEDLAKNIVRELLLSSELYLPQETLCNSIIERYLKDPHEYGVHSYQYKQQSGRVKNEHKAIVGYLSGTFDLFHIGHLNLLKKAKALCDYLVVGVHDSGAWKGKETFISFEERKQIVGACQYVDKVVSATREDSDAWELWKYHKLFVGSDYKGSPRFAKYESFFKDKNVEIVYFPYTQGISSTQLREKLTEKAHKDSQ